MVHEDHDILRAFLARRFGSVHVLPIYPALAVFPFFPLLTGLQLVHNCRSCAPAFELNPRS